MNKFEKILLTIFFIEVFVGGGGRLIDFGVLSIRQVLFLLLIAVFIVRIIKEKAFFNKKINTFLQFNPVTIGVYLLVGWFVVSSIIGVLNGHPLGMIVTDFFRVSYFVVYFPLAYYISKERFSLQRIITLLKYSALAVALFTIIISLLGKTVFVGANFKPFYDFLNRVFTGDLFFRPSNSVFYKSHFFVLIGLVIALNDLFNKSKSKLSIALVIFGSVSVLWSETRGFLLAFMLSVFMIIVLDVKVLVDPIKGLVSKLQKLVHNKQFIKKFTILILVVVAVPFLYKYMTLERFEVVKPPASNVQPNVEPNQAAEEQEPQVNDISVNNRLEFIIASKDILVHPANLVFGSGYGTEVAGRITGLEMSFLDILVEQGLIGLGIWVFLFFIVYFNYYIAYKKGHKLTSLEISLLSAFMGVLLLTNINPFINNPIGISFFIVLLIASQQKRDLTKNEVIE
ncbi:hypothetical protein FB550_11019 [Neobacillus bataviensis]|uniref:O-antigen ligase-like membrane protein n=1 Tax=Neobacillus bataviensis TaxID=220685 RepID=A0A561D271_9BACI|nr:hypothetical protein [Neobacillus bataviensis]TWD97414.1 hypothetical protein FB550_11019 [Neobacillus bataviensis]